MSVSILIPYIRYEGMKRCVDSIISNETKLNYEILTEEDIDRNGVALTLHKLLQTSRNDIVVFLADDTEIEKDCLNIAYDILYKAFDNGIGMVGFNDGIHNSKLATHFMIHKELIKQIGGYIFHPAYTHCYADNELYDRVNELDKYIYCQFSKIIHHHPLINNNIDWDDDYKRVYNKSVYLKDQRTYRQRKENGWR